ncbi:MAG: hypothetical protein HDT14_08795 [Oscillibacter sp.]|nr:hypothetical protein [Oscillibacter sp.]
MSANIKEYIEEINQNYNDLGENLLMLEAVLLAREEETGFPEEYIASSVKRLTDYIDQHVGELRQVAGILVRQPHQYAPRHRAGRRAAIARIRRSKHCWRPEAPAREGRSNRS